MTLEHLQERLGHRFTDISLLDLALTHVSSSKTVSYERLEFLGDRVLGLVIAHWLYETFPKEAEGAMAKRLAALVEASFLTKLASDLDLGHYIHLSDAERASSGGANANILADVMEAIIGAVYLDAGLEAARGLIHTLVGNALHEAIEPPQHPKTTLQEWAQGRGLPLPLYEVIERSGPDHAPFFTLRVTVEGKGEALGSGPNRQAAERAAAQSFLACLEHSTH